MPRSRNDHLIEEIVSGDVFKFENNGLAYSRINKQGHLCNEWRRIGYPRNGYIRFKYKNKHIPLHRVIYRKFIGELRPEQEVNHIDGDRTNNSVANLELVTRAQNNQLIPIHNKKVVVRDVLAWISDIEKGFKEKESKSIFKTINKELLNRVSIHHHSGNES